MFLSLIQTFLDFLLLDQDSRLCCVCLKVRKIIEEQACDCKQIQLLPDEHYLLVMDAKNW